MILTASLQDLTLAGDGSVASISRLQWSPVEEFDEFDVPIAVHIMPVVVNEGFPTKQKALDFLDAVEAADFPCLTDEDGNIIATYFGHTVNAECHCWPDSKEDCVLPTYFHHPIQ